MIVASCTAYALPSSPAPLRSGLDPSPTAYRCILHPAPAHKHHHQPHHHAGTRLYRLQDDERARESGGVLYRV